MRPAEVCGWVRRPSDSSAASSARIVELLVSTTSVSALLLTGVPVEMYSSRVLVSISRCLTEIVMPEILPRWSLASVPRYLRGLDPQRREESFLRYLYVADLLHAAFPCLLTFEELALAGDIPAIALRRDVFAVR